MKQKRGFTLVELIVAMAVSAIALSMLALIFTSVGAFLDKKQSAADLNSEIMQVESQITQAVNAGILQEFSGESTILTITKPTEIVNVYYSESGLKVGESALVNFKEITNVTFEMCENILKCNLFYGENSSFFLVNLA